jgi:hypothetical protein
MTDLPSSVPGPALAIHAAYSLPLGPRPNPSGLTPSEPTP